MAEYHRFVSYMYAYENNKKTVNNGFVRVETRDRISSVYVNMKELYGSNTKYNVYMVQRTDGGFNGICLGEIGRKQGGGEFCCKITKDNIYNSGISLIEIAGIIILGENGRKYGTCWDDEALDVELFSSAVKPGETLVKVQKNERIGEAAEEDKEVPETVEAAAEHEAVDKAEAEAETETEAETEDGEFKELMAESIAMSAPDMAEAADFFKEPLIGGALVWNSSEAAAAENKEKAVRKRLNRILEGGIKMYPFEDGEIESCIRMEIQDIGMLPMKYWFYAGNSFVLHSYFSYRHLILAKKADGSFILGIPGMDEQKDTFMAEQFGFHQFKSIREKSDETPASHFGYWYVKLAD